MLYYDGSLIIVLQEISLFSHGDEGPLNIVKYLRFLPNRVNHKQIKHLSLNNYDMKKLLE
jgi:hypothetical protein